MLKKVKIIGITLNLLKKILISWLIHTLQITKYELII